MRGMRDSGRSSEELTRTWESRRSSTSAVQHQRSSTLVLLRRAPPKTMPSDLLASIVRNRAVQTARREALRSPTKVSESLVSWMRYSR